MADVLIIGCGKIAGGWDEGRTDTVVRTHAKAFSGHAGFRLAACVEPDATRRNEFMAAWGVAEGFASLDELKGRRFDVASLCSPTARHAADLETLLGLDVRLVFAEKPLTDDIAASRRQVAAYRERGRTLVVNHNRRFDPTMTSLRQRIRAGEFGRLLTGIGLYGKGILNNGSHLVDLAQYLLGPLELRQVERFLYDYSEQDPSVDAVLETPEGAPLRLITVDQRAVTVFELELVFEQARLRMADSGFALSTQRVRESEQFPGYKVLTPPMVEATGLGQAMAVAVEMIANHLRTGTDLPSTGDTALAAQELCAHMIALAKESSP